MLRWNQAALPHQRKTPEKGRNDPSTFCRLLPASHTEETLWCDAVSAFSQAAAVSVCAGHKVQRDPVPLIPALFCFPPGLD